MTANVRCAGARRWLQSRNRHGLLAFKDIGSPGFDPALYHKTHEELKGVIHGGAKLAQIIFQIVKIDCYLSGLASMYW
jgi:hypothetical protein